jgi:hypothetical protein
MSSKLSLCYNNNNNNNNNSDNINITTRTPWRRGLEILRVTQKLRKFPTLRGT